MGWVSGAIMALASAIWATKVFMLTGSIAAVASIVIAAIYIVVALLLAVREVR